MPLPSWIEKKLTAHHVRIVRYGRTRKGRPAHLERRWFFCGWYYHREVRQHVLDGPHGPFPCISAAMVDAMGRYKLGETETTIRHR